MSNGYDFSGWATRNDLKCSDGRTIRRDAFKDNDGQTVPLVWQHMHDAPSNVLGHALLENREEGVYAYGKFNETEYGKMAKELVQNGDIKNLSIYANKLKQNGGNVLHGAIREVSLVLAGANPGAYIEFPVLSHSGDTVDDEAVIFTGEELFLNHEEEEQEPEELEETQIEEEEMEDNRELEHAEEQKDERTVQDVLDTMNEEQIAALNYVVGMALQEDPEDYDDDDEDEDEGENEEMKHNVFDNDERQSDVLSHAEMDTIISDAKRFGSLKESFLAHAGEYGITDIEYLFPEAKSLNTPPEFIKREDSWVQKVMNGVHHTPFSRIKSMFANITEDEARAKGYIKGKLKKEEVFSLLKRTTTPQTIYKKQKLDRDDVIDITDFDVVAWLKSEMRMMLDEEIARAILVGDGRLVSDDDHISHDHIRPIAFDAALYSVQVPVENGSTEPKEIIKSTIRARKQYKGSGNPTFFTTEDVLAEMLLIEDGIGHLLYESEQALATRLRVKEIVTVPVMEGLKTTDNKDLLGIMVNLNDYNVGADKGGAINMFDDFDIDYNQMKYLIETRCSGALIKPYSALVFHNEPKAD